MEKTKKTAILDWDALKVRETRVRTDDGPIIAAGSLSEIAGSGNLSKMRDLGLRRCTTLEWETTEW